MPTASAACRHTDSTSLAGSFARATRSRSLRRVTLRVSRRPSMRGSAGTSSTRRPDGREDRCGTAIGFVSRLTNLPVFTPPTPSTSSTANRRAGSGCFERECTAACRSPSSSTATTSVWRRQPRAGPLSPRECTRASRKQSILLGSAPSILFRSTASIDSEPARRWFRPRSSSTTLAFRICSGARAYTSSRTVSTRRCSARVAPSRCAESSVFQMVRCSSPWGA